MLFLFVPIIVLAQLCVLPRVLLWLGVTYMSWYTLWKLEGEADQSSTEDWWQAYAVDGSYGLFPANHAMLLAECAYYVE